MKRLLWRIVVYFCIFVVFVGGIGLIGFLREKQDYWTAGRKQPVPALQGLVKPAYDPNKPTVAVVLGNPTTEVFDFMVPYEMFVMTDAYNVYAVAQDHHVTTLTGGLDLAPHYSFQELDQMLGKSPDLIVVPFIPIVDEEKYKPVREWLQKHANTQILSICGGAANIADAGLAKGKSITTHWQVFTQFSKMYPDANWVRGLRYVHDGNVVASAGLTSGIDAVLYVISQQLGEPMAEKIAQEMNYPSYHFVKNPKVEPYYIDWSEAIYNFNQAFQWNRKKTGVLLYNGMDDGALTTIFDTYAASGTTKVYTIASSKQPIVTKYHLNLIPRYDMSDAPKIERMFVTGSEAKSMAADVVKQWNDKGTGVEPEFIHSESADRFIFDAPLEDLAKQEDILTAKYGAKRLEYRATHLKLEGKPFSFETFGILFLLTVISVLLARYIDRRFIIGKIASSKHC
ncbi:DJ-1/PfpI family protein [Brevibacillus sp. SYP-B805]|uniref:DJ-1/PfpI family protein n=1 Tax=Brevibacillus sp. SYP-B805 TaxID=1578199 RepID=UPI0013EB86FD|nr:DJ-1/PfpI family protein [Brevibacillus sp. SYP-B805]NGQ95295.1 DJ-1/PfpI family protein [Brevibacillus sp. SYP-B805]